MLCLKIVKDNIFTKEEYFSTENITEIVNLYLGESGKMAIHLDNSFEEQLIAEMNLSGEFELNTLKEATNLQEQDWQKISDSMSNFEYCNDGILNYLFELNPSLFDTDLYKSFMKAIFTIVEKGQISDKIDLKFERKFSKDKSKQILVDDFRKKSAFCRIIPNENLLDCLDKAEYTKDKKYKRLKFPQVEIDGKYPRVIKNTEDFIILSEDGYAEFFVSCKILECCIKVVSNKYDLDIDCKNNYLSFYELYTQNMDLIRSSLELEKHLHCFDYRFFEEMNDNDGD